MKKVEYAVASTVASVASIYLFAYVIQTQDSWHHPANVAMSLIVLGVSIFSFHFFIKENS